MELIEEDDIHGEPVKEIRTNNEFLLGSPDSPHNMYTAVNYKGKKTVIRKSSAAWLLSEKNIQLSRGRLQMVNSGIPYEFYNLILKNRISSKSRLKISYYLTHFALIHILKFKLLNLGLK